MKVGDKVRCLDNSGAPRDFKTGEIYTIRSIEDGRPCSKYLIRVKELNDYIGMFCYRFEVVQNEQPSSMAPSLPATRLVDEFGFPEPKKAQISLEDLELAKRFLSNLKDQTLSRGIHKVLSNLLERLP